MRSRWKVHGRGRFVVCVFRARPESQLSLGELDGFVLVDVVDSQTSTPVQGIKANGRLHGAEITNQLIGRADGEGSICFTSSFFGEHGHIDDELCGVPVVVKVVRLKAVGPSCVVSGGRGDNGGAVMHGPFVEFDVGGVSRKIVGVCH